MTICGSIPFSLLKISIDSMMEANLMPLSVNGKLVGLPLEPEVRFPDVLQRDAHQPAPGGLQRNYFAVFKSPKRTLPEFSILDRLAQRKTGLLPRKPLKIA